MSNPIIHCIDKKWPTFIINIIKNVLLKKMGKSKNVLCTYTRTALGKSGLRWKSNLKIVVNVFLAMNREKSRRAGTTYCNLTLYGTTVRTPQSMLSPDGIMKRFVVQPVVGDIHQATRTAILNTLGWTCKKLYNLYINFC